MPIDRPLLAVPAVICRDIIATDVSSEAAVPGSLREKPIKIGTQVVRSNLVVAWLDETENHAQQPMGIWEMSAQMAEA
jgi:hypothetical protein